MIFFLLLYYISKEIIDLRKVIFVDLIYGKYQFREDIFTLKYQPGQWIVNNRSVFVFSVDVMIGHILQSRCECIIIYYIEYIFIFKIEKILSIRKYSIFLYFYNFVHSLFFYPSGILQFHSFIKDSIMIRSYNLIIIILQ